MRRGQPTKLGLVLLIAVAAVVLIGGVIWAGQAIFSGNGAKSEDVNAGQKLLDKPTENTAVRMSVRGPINAAENHYSIIMTISGSAREITTFRGYSGEVIKSEKLKNTEAGFKDFLAALNRAGYMKENVGMTEPNQGVCAVGQLIGFEALEYQRDDKGKITEKSAKKLWTTSCVDLNGNFAGLQPNVIDLFVKQMPSARAIIDHAKNTVERTAIYRDNYDVGLGSVR